MILALYGKVNLSYRCPDEADPLAESYDYSTNTDSHLVLCYYPIVATGLYGTPDAG